MMKLDQRIFPLYEEGMGCRRIARIVGADPTLVYKRIKRSKLNRSRKESPGGSMPARALTKPKRYAQAVLQNAVTRGRLEKQPCWACGSTKVEAHHWDYARPLDIFWLCRRHHIAAHDGRLQLRIPAEPISPPGPWGNTGKRRIPSRKASHRHSGTGHQGSASARRHFDPTSTDVPPPANTSSSPQTA